VAHSPDVDAWFVDYDNPLKDAMEGGGDTARYMRLADLAEVEAAANDLRRVVVAWCDRPDRRPQ
jgi:hypothetical protein